MPPKPRALGAALLSGARFYIPALGRFLTPDPIGHAGGLNLYAYCENNPVVGIDPSGHSPQLPSFKDISNYAAGMGDHISGSVLSMAAPGLIPQLFFGSARPTQRIRQLGGYDGNVDFASGAYGWGQRSGVAWDLSLGLSSVASVWEGLGGSTMKVMIGKGGPSHVMYQVGDQVLHGFGRRGAMTVSSESLAAFERMTAMEGGWRPFLTFSLPIRNAAAAGMSGMPVKNCAQAAAKAFWRGWRF